MSIGVKRGKLENSPDYFKNGLDSILSSVVVALKIIGKRIITVSQW